jgi:hypothetical protein
MPARAEARDCLVPDCSAPGRNQLGVRCRIAHSGASPFPDKRRTDAIFSVESDAFLCDAHALNGAQMHLVFQATRSANASLRASCGSNEIEGRTKPIRQPVDAIEASAQLAVDLDA